VIGGVSLFGGRGTVLGAFFGVVFVKLLDNSLNLLGLSYFVILVVKGSVILAAALLDAGRAGLAAWLARRSPS
jgi:ribose transport system permease protein